MAKISMRERLTLRKWLREHGVKDIHDTKSTASIFVNTPIFEYAIKEKRYDLFI